ncbi:Uncharacterized protein OBRU01_04446 [Operophtera brumata]|uniref:Uncharacterized protein n=1 Tax=Operophtera brumata TaxID=104452 RepID=A0A0L7LPW8_OPEBR|nr:Uncharacterized protein OBRU01_04446 [Operophtera brumata]
MQKDNKVEDSKPSKLALDIREFAQELSDLKSKSPLPSPRITRSTSSKMSELGLNTLFKFIKSYDGSRETVNSFIINCNNAYDLAAEEQKPILFKYILSQLSGKAELACSIKDFTSWEQLKEFLKTQFKTSILTLSFQLEDVTNAILFSSQNILHPAIMTSSQLYRELANNYRHLSRDLQLPIALDMNNIHYLLMFVLQVPLVGIKEYTLFHNIALPTPYDCNEPYKFTLIIPGNKYIAMTKDKLQHCTFDDMKECKVVSPGNFICDVTNVYTTDAMPSCESELLSKVIREVPKQCDVKFVYGKLDIWKPLANNKWIFVQSEPNKVSIDCLNSKFHGNTYFAQ